jgi:hypothetical protein
MHTLRSRGFALATLVAFLAAQPVVGCVALCFFGAHHAGAHTMAGTGGSSTLGNDACHTINVGAVQRDPIQALSPMEPASAPVIAFTPAKSVEPVRTLPTPPGMVSRTVESPPPRFV